LLAGEAVLMAGKAVLVTKTPFLVAEEAMMGLEKLSRWWLEKLNWQQKSCPGG
jgi:hypothetical protein